jgi:signal peptidase I
MKRVIFLGLIIALIIGSCAQEKKSPIEGAWQLVYAKGRSMEETFPAQISGDQVKMFINGHLTWVGQFKMPADTAIQYDYGLGTYTLDGNKFIENVKIHAQKSAIGTKKMIMEIRNDTLIQRWPTDENYNLPEKYNTMKYIRLD